MLVENQLVEVKWSSTNRDFYINRGYKYTQIGDTFLIKADDAHPNSRITKIRVRCDYCGGERIISTQDYYKNTQNGLVKYSCGKKGCLSNKRTEFDYKRKEVQFKKFIDLCAEKGYTPISSIDDYSSSLYSKLKYKCPFHDIQEITLNNLQHGQGCKLCGKEKRIDSRRLSVNAVRSKIEFVNHNIWLNPSEYKNNSTSNLKILCGICGKRHFITNLNCYIYDHKNKCDYCARSQSNNERIIQYFLEKYCINYIHNFRFHDCRDKRSLPFDFYLTDYNLVIEFDGIQHYLPVYGEEKFKTTKLHDAMKDNYCRWNNIDLLRIPYWEGNNIEQILIDYLHLTPQSKNKPIKIKYIPNRKSA